MTGEAYDDDDNDDDGGECKTVRKVVSNVPARQTDKQADNMRKTLLLPECSKCMLQTSV